MLKQGLEQINFEELVDEQESKKTNPVTVRVENLCYKIGEAKILDDITADFVPGELVALMGPSGAGKTTLLKTLSGRFQKFVESGKISINGKPLDPPRFKLISNMIPQEDTLLGTLKKRSPMRPSSLPPDAPSRSAPGVLSRSCWNN